MLSSTSLMWMYSSSSNWFLFFSSYFEYIYIFVSFVLCTYLLFHATIFCLLKKVSLWCCRCCCCWQFVSLLVERCCALLTSFLRLFCLSVYFFPHFLLKHDFFFVLFCTNAFFLLLLLLPFLSPLHRLSRGFIFNLFIMLLTLTAFLRSSFYCVQISLDFKRVSPTTSRTALDQTRSALSVNRLNI